MKKQRSSLKSPSSPSWTVRAKDVPATQGALQLVRSELKAEMKAGFRKIDSRFSQIDSKFGQMDSKFSQMDSKFSQMDSKFEQVLSEVARVGTLVEEQNSRNQIVLEGLSGLFQRQGRLEVRMDAVEAGVRGLGARSRK